MAMSVDAKLLKQTKFPPEFSQKVDMKKVNVEVMKKYAHSTSKQYTVLIYWRLKMDCWQDLRDTWQ